MVHGEPNGAVFVSLVVFRETRSIEKDVEILLRDGFAVPAIH